MREEINNDPVYVSIEQFMALEARVDAIEKDMAVIKTTIQHIQEEVRELRSEIRELRMLMLGGFVAVIATSILLRLLLG